MIESSLQSFSRHGYLVTSHATNPLLCFAAHDFRLLVEASLTNNNCSFDQVAALPDFIDVDAGSRFQKLSDEKEKR